MNTNTVATLSVLTTLLLGLGLAQEPDDESITWRTDLEAARAEALASGRPLLVVFR